jgi:hypothetical protein
MSCHSKMKVIAMVINFAAMCHVNTGFAKCNDVSYVIIVHCTAPVNVLCHDYVRKRSNFFIGWWATLKISKTIMEGKRYLININQDPLQTD